jgi:4-hydroxythreonine-4-phosphate dehydrogenase
VTLGDPAGIGGEIIFKALEKIGARSIPVIVGDDAVLRTYAAVRPPHETMRFKGFMEGRHGDVELLDLGIVKEVVFGASDATCGEASYRYVLEALKLLFTGAVSALVTCPISKKSIRQAGVTFPGHTELLAHYGGVTDYVMMMATGDFRVSLVTIHIALKEVPTSITSAGVFKCISITNGSLKTYFGLEHPRIKVCGLNPHAGEQGLMGDEEGLISEGIDHARSLGIRVEGPFPADSLFYHADSDAYVAMYHDQGLIPVKTVNFRKSVNITLGLPFIRTSVGHGTGFDIAGQGKADPTSLIEAYRTAERMLHAST